MTEILSAITDLPDDLIFASDSVKSYLTVMSALDFSVWFVGNKLSPELAGIMSCSYKHPSPNKKCTFFSSAYSQTVEFYVSNFISRGQQGTAPAGKAGRRAIHSIKISTVNQSQVHIQQTVPELMSN